MAVFTSYDGADLTYQVSAGPGTPLVCLPGGPLRATRYLGNLGELDEHRALVMFELPRRRVDEVVNDVEALRVHLGLEKLDLLAHSAGGNLAMLYAAAFPQRIGKLALITPGLRAVGLQPTDEEFFALFERRSDEGWYAEARSALDAVENGDETPANGLAAAAFQYGRWDEAAQRHAAGVSEETITGAAAIFYAEGAFNVPAVIAGLTHLESDVLIVVGEKDFLPTESRGRQLTGLFPRATMVIQKGAGHYPWIDSPTEFISIVRPFFT